MPALLDTSVVVRYLTQSPPDQGTEAAVLLDGTEDFVVPTVTLAETAFVLGRFYGIDRAATVDLLAGVLGKDNVEVLDVPTELAVEALMLCRPSGRVSFADALEWAVARHSGKTTVFTFDRSFPDQGIDRRVLGRRDRAR